MYEYFTITSGHAERTWRLYKCEKQLKETEKIKYIGFIMDANMDGWNTLCVVVGGYCEMQRL